MRVKAKANIAQIKPEEFLYQGITPSEHYFVIEISQDDFRVMDDKGEPILYPKVLFEVLDMRLPSGWRYCEYADGEYHVEPLQTGRPGFYEDFFCSDGDRIAQASARQALREALERAREAGDEEDRRLIQRDLGRLNQMGAAPS